MELLTTVYWVADQEGAGNADEAIKRTYAWNDRKRMFTSEQIHIAWEVLAEHKWLSPSPC